MSIIGIRAGNGARALSFGSSRVLVAAHNETKLIHSFLHECLCVFQARVVAVA